MLLAFGLAFAGDPAAPAPAPPPSTSLTVDVRRACDAGRQRCGDRRVPWSEPCDMAVREGLRVVDEDRQVKFIGDAVCGARLQEPAPKPPDPGTTAALQIVGSLACASAASVAGGYCDPDPTRAVVPPIPDQHPPCQATELAPAPTPPAPAPR